MDNESKNVLEDDEIAKQIKEGVDHEIELSHVKPRMIQLTFYPENSKLSIDPIGPVYSNFAEIRGILELAIDIMKSSGVRVAEEETSEQS